MALVDLELLQSSVVLIASEDQGDFGTGFVIHRDESYTYLLTCAHVVEDIAGPDLEKRIYVEDAYHASVACDGGEYRVDLAILRIEGPENLREFPLFELGTPEVIGPRFHTAGCCREDRIYSNTISGSMNVGPVLVLGKGQGRAMMWDLSTDSGRLQKGYSGAPVVDATSGLVVGVIVAGNGRSGLAISIETLKVVWPKMPPDLLREADTDFGVSQIELNFPIASSLSNLYRSQYIFDITNNRRPRYGEEVEDLAKHLERQLIIHGSRLQQYEIQRKGTESRSDIVLASSISREEHEIARIGRHLTELFVRDIAKTLYRDCAQIVEKVLSRLAMDQLLGHPVCVDDLENWIKDLVISNYSRTSLEYQNALAEICQDEVENSRYLSRVDNSERDSGEYIRFSNDLLLAYYTALGLVSDKEQQSSTEWLPWVSSSEVGQTTLELVCALSTGDERLLVETIIEALLKDDDITGALRCFVNRGQNVWLRKGIEDSLMECAEQTISTWVADGDWILEQLCSDPSVDVRQHMMKSLLPQLGSQAVPYQLLGIKDKERPVRREAAISLRKLRDFGTHKNTLITSLPDLYALQLTKDRLEHDDEIEIRYSLLGILQELESEEVSRKLRELGVLEEAKSVFNRTIQDIKDEKQPETAGQDSQKEEQPGMAEVLEERLKQELEALQALCRKV
jgi:hypothetical protein